MICKCIHHRVEVRSNANVHVADLRFRQLAEGPLGEGVLELFGGEEEGFYTGGHVARVYEHFVPTTVLMIYMDLA